MRRLLSFILILAITPLAGAQRSPKPRPRLVVLIVCDQFRYDYLTRFAPLFGKGGFRRLMHDGALWTNANFNYIPTKTAPGHAALMTGASPSGHGVIANEWYDRASGRKVFAAIDSGVKTLGGGPRESANSPHRLLASTFGDELRDATSNRAKVIGISDKPRAAIMPSGRRANAAYWLSSSAGTVISSSYYFPDLPDWVKEFNKTQPLDKYFGARWDRVLAEREYLKYAGPDAPPWENIDKAPAQTNTFPHWVTGGAKQPNAAFYDALDHSPFVNDVLVTVAKAAIEHEQLGADDVTDVLTISLSGTDHVGHRFGPVSQEVMDVVLRADKQVEQILDFIDERVGLQNSIVVFSSDHGVSPLLDKAAMEKQGGLRIGSSQIAAAIRERINARYGRAASDYILQYEEGGAKKNAILNGQVYLNRSAIERDGLNFDEVAEVAGKAVLKINGIARYFTSAQLQRCTGGKSHHIRVSSCEFVDRFYCPPEIRSTKSHETTRNLTIQNSCPSDPIFQSVLHGYYPERSGDLIIVQKPFNYIGDSADPANHGTPYWYDTHVPVIIMGPGFKRGRYVRAIAPADVAPTLSYVLGIPKPNRSQGRVLREALQ